MLLHQHGRSHRYGCGWHASGIDFACRGDRDGDRYCGGSDWDWIDRRNGRTTNRAFAHTCSTVAAHCNVTARAQTRIHIFSKAHHTFIILTGRAGTHGDGHGRHGRDDFRCVGNWNSGSHRSRLWPIGWRPGRFGEDAMVSAVVHIRHVTLKPILSLPFKRNLVHLCCIAQIIA